MCANCVPVGMQYGLMYKNYTVSNNYYTVVVKLLILLVILIIVQLVAQVLQVIRIVVQSYNPDLGELLYQYNTLSTNCYTVSTSSTAITNILH